MVVLNIYRRQGAIKMPALSRLRQLSQHQSNRFFVGFVLEQSRAAKVWFGPVLRIFLNLELNFRFGSGKLLNLELGSGSVLSLEPN